MPAPYTQNELPSGLNLKTSLDQADLHVIGDQENSGQAAAITEANLELTIADSLNFITALVGNTDFTDALAEDANFIAQLTQNSIFQNAVNNFIIGGGGGGAGSSISQTFNFGDFTNDGMGNGVATFSSQLPLGSVPIGVIYEFVSAFNTGSTMKVLDSQTHNMAIGALVAADTTKTLVGETDGLATFDFNATPNPIVVIPGVIPTMGQVKVFVLYGAGSSGVSIDGIAVNTLTKGKAVGVSDMVGSSVDLYNRSNLTHIIPNFAPQAGAGVQVGTNKIFIAYKDSSSGNLMGVVCNTNSLGMVLTPGTAQTLVASGSFTNTNFSVTSPTTGTVAVAYQNGTSVLLVIATISGTVLTIGTPVTAYTDSGNTINVRVAPVSTSAVIVGSAGNGGSGAKSDYIVATISGTTPTFGSLQQDSTYYRTSLGVSVMFDFQFISSGVVIQIGMSTFNVSGPTKNFGARVLSISGTVITFGTIVEVSSGDSGSVLPNTFRGGITLIDSTKIAFTQGWNGIGGAYNSATFFIVCDFTGTTISHIVLALNDFSTSQSGDLTNVWVNNGFVFFTSSGPGGTGIQGPVTQYLYTGGSSISYKGVASNSHIFSGLIIPVSGYLIGFTGASSYLMSGISTIGFTGFIQEDVTAGQTALVLTNGEDSNQSNLVAGQRYQVGANGVISIGSGDYTLDAGQAINATTILKS